MAEGLVHWKEGKEGQKGEGGKKTKGGGESY